MGRPLSMTMTSGLVLVRRLDMIVQLVAQMLSQSIKVDTHSDNVFRTSISVKLGVITIKTRIRIRATTFVAQSR